MQQHKINYKKVSKKTLLLLGGVPAGGGGFSKLDL
jgi:hypothetical protein